MNKTSKIFLSLFLAGASLLGCSDGVPKPETNNPVVSRTAEQGGLEKEVSTPVKRELTPIYDYGSITAVRDSEKLPSLEKYGVKDTMELLKSELAGTEKEEIVISPLDYFVRDNCIDFLVRGASKSGKNPGGDLYIVRFSKTGRKVQKLTYNKAYEIACFNSEGNIIYTESLLDDSRSRLTAFEEYGINVLKPTEKADKMYETSEDKKEPSYYFKKPVRDFLEVYQGTINDNGKQKKVIAFRYYDDEKDKQLRAYVSESEMQGGKNEK
jgi:hypothetical protein